MTQIMLRHSTKPKYRESILAEGLEPRNPAEWNYPGMWTDQPTGVYTFEAGHGYSWGGGVNLIFPYVGPFLKDQLIPSAFVVPERVPPAALTIEE